ncbi:MAG: 6-carboxytetrahydropterin synthase [Bryobacteraceae bacterium]|nr:6-carboxytetrahydropterin synthase [Bryobacteraceae bacterium]
MIRIGRRYRFSASHRLHAPELSAERNREVFGKCNNPHGHGHDYVLELVVAGEPDPSTGLLLHTGALDRFVREAVLNDYDHRYMNEQIAAFRSLPPTTENVALDIRRRLRDGWRDALPAGACLESVRIFETRRNAVELDCQES